MKLHSLRSTHKSCLDSDFYSFRLPTPWQRIPETQAKYSCQAVSALRLKRASPDTALYNDLGVSLLLSALRL